MIKMISNGNDNDTLHCFVISSQFTLMKPWQTKYGLFCSSKLVVMNRKTKQGKVTQAKYEISGIELTNKGMSMMHEIMVSKVDAQNAW